jgi:hypothetical protein
MIKRKQTRHDRKLYLLLHKGNIVINFLTTCVSKKYYLGVLCEVEPLIFSKNVHLASFKQSNNI